eukprot:scaffold94709_cov21-Tisochrysis_lutea.AAC.3
MAAVEMSTHTRMCVMALLIAGFSDSIGPWTSLEQQARGKNRCMQGEAGGTTMDLLSVNRCKEGTKRHTYAGVIATRTAG